MKEHNIESLWKSSTQKASDYYKSIEDDILQKANKESNGIFAKIRRNIIYELIASVIVAIGFPFLFWNDFSQFILMVSIMTIILGLTFYFYMSYLRQIKQVHEPNILTALKLKEKILDGYIKKLKVFLYIAAIIGFLVGAFSGKEDFILLDLKNLFVLVIGAPIVALLMWLGNKYIWALYKKHLHKLRECIKGLEEEN
jgi:purine-cytosine permease-like protein